LSVAGKAALLLMMYSLFSSMICRHLIVGTVNSFVDGFR